MAVSKKSSKKVTPTRPVKEDSGPPYVQRHPSSKLPIPGEPPPILRNYDGKAELMQDYPSYIVALDAGAFMWLWRIVEAKALQHHESATIRNAAPEAVRVALHAATAFREAAGTTQSRLSDPSKGRKRVLKRV